MNRSSADLLDDVSISVMATKALLL